MEEDGGRDPAPLGWQFTSRLTTPSKSYLEDVRQSHTIEGVTVPPRPEEPDNCCMSGCVHCVWDMYREDLEIWQSARRQASTMLLQKGKQIPAILIDEKLALDANPLEALSPTLQAFVELERKLKLKREKAQQRAAAS